MYNTNHTSLALALIALAMISSHTHGQSIYTPYAFTNLAGLPGVTGADDGTGAAARFQNPEGATVDALGNVYVVDHGNHTIRKITPAGVVTTVAGLPGVREPLGADGTGSEARFNFPTGVAVDTNGNLYVTDRLNSTIRKLTPDGTNWVVTTIAGSAGQASSADGTGSAARFFSPTGVAVDRQGNLFVTDFGNETIRRIMPEGTNWVVSTIAGAVGQSGSADGIGIAARFYVPAGIVVDSSNRVYVADQYNHALRKITYDGVNWVVSTIAGYAAEPGSADGNGDAARLALPYGLAVDSHGSIFVTDFGNSTIRKLTPDGTNWVVTTIAGSAGQFSSDDGSGAAARFHYPQGVAVDRAGNVYVVDTKNHRVTKGTPLLLFDTSTGRLTVSNDLFQVRLIGPYGRNAVVEASPNLQAWAPIQTNALPSGGLNISVQVGTNQHQFFRAYLEPAP